MERLNKDELFSFAIHLELPDLLKFCATSKKINNLICKKDIIWNYKLNKDFPYWEEETTFLKQVKDKSLKEIYILLYQLTTLKKKLYLRGDIYMIYGMTVLDLPNRRISELPKEIGALKNLQVLYIMNNYLTRLPKEIGNLPQLSLLYLNDNLLTSIPEEIANLPKLSLLNLDYNKLNDLPVAIVNMKKLRLLSLKGNPLSNLSPEIRNFLDILNKK